MTTTNNNTNMENFLDFCKSYKKEWAELERRKFNEKELASMQPEATVVASNYGRSYCFTILSDNKTKYLPLDKKDSTDVGETVSTKDLYLVRIKYEGDDPNVLKNIPPSRIVLRGLYESEDSSQEVTSYDDPFGIG